MAAREALEIATLGGARVLGRDDCGVITPGMRADIAIFDVSGIAAAGAWDPVAALVLCGPFMARDLLVEGRDVVRDGRLVTRELPHIVEAAHAAIARLMA
jgi:cytosine/adenosine deaminase-related metal-dependent hydrolase